MKITEVRVNEAIDAYDWEPAATWQASQARHAVMERYAPGAMRTLCGHVFGIRAVVDKDAVWFRCGSCLNVIYARLAVDIIR